MTGGAIFVAPCGAGDVLYKRKDFNVIGAEAGEV
jgi:hypothetical protein